MNRTFRAAFSSVLLVASMRVRALDPSKSISQYGLDAWGTRDGLPQNSVSALLQTRNGYLWMGTEEGLVRFDGVRFSVYSTRNTTAFRQNRIEALAEGPDDSLWIGTVDGLLRKRGDEFTAYGVAEGLPNETIMTLLAEPDGSLWIGTLRGGLACWRNERFVSRLTGAEGLPSDMVIALARSRDGSLWVGTDGGLACVRGGRVVSQMRTSDGLPANRVNDILEGRDGELWVATSGGLARLSDGRATAVTNGKEFSGINVLLQDRGGTLWTGTSRGLSRARGGAIEPFDAADGPPHGVVVGCLLEDHEGNLWIGTDGDGVLRLRDAPIATYGKRDGLTNEFVYTVLEDSHGTVWLGTRGGGLNRLRDGRISALTTHDGLPHDAVSALTQARDGALWIGTAGGGVARLKDGRIRVWGKEDGLSSNLIRVLLEDRRGALWVGTSGGGLDRLDQGRVTAFTVSDGLAGDTIMDLCEDRDGVLWIGTTTGVSRLQDGSFKTFRASEGLSYAVRVLKADPDGTLWIGTSGGGLFRMRDGRLSAVTARQGLYDDVVFAILDDGAGNLWMSCNRGLFRVARHELVEFFAGTRASVTCAAYGEADGMKSAECNGGFQPSAWRGRDGRLWFATIRGVAVVDPQAIRVNREPPPVVLERIVVDGRDLGAVARQAFSPGSRSIELDYAGLSFVSSERMRFKYRLEGVDSDWLDVGPRRAAYYTNLSPGRYVFRVIASNSDGVWNQTGAMLPFSIRPFFWQTIWFYALCAGLVLFAAAAAIQVRVRSLRLREDELKRRVAEGIARVRVLSGLLPICSWCKKVRDDAGYWKQIESYIRDHSEAEFTHGICPDCEKTFDKERRTER
ncbi:MAG: two-component regulator propeller domain-containing protein [Thermoanaerobaculia bacterium]